MLQKNKISNICSLEDENTLAQAIRYLLAYVGEEFTDERKSYKDYEKWHAEKYSINGLELPNLPYYQDKDVTLSQAGAILRYIADKHGMTKCKTPAERARLDMVDLALGDIRSALTRMFYMGGDYEELKGQFLSTLPKTLETWAKFMGSNTFLMGNEVQYVDFVFFELLDLLLYMEPKCFGACLKITQYYDHMKKLPKLNAFLKSDKCKHWPLNGVVAKFGAGEAPKLHEF